MRLARFYPIVDAGLLAARGIDVGEFAVALAYAGVTLLQYRNKAGEPLEMLRDAEMIAGVFAESPATLIFNDRADLAMLAGWDGVHVGQDDLSAEDTRRVVGESRYIGVSTHNEEQVRAADASEADYVAIGPVYATSTKENPDPEIGLEGVRKARALTTKPLVAIGGITRANALSVMVAGADAVAVISELVVSEDGPEKVARDFIELLR